MSRKGERKMNSVGQVSMFVIVAIVIVAGAVLLFAFRDSLFGSRIPAEFQPVYGVYSECIADSARAGISLLGSQGGRIETGEYAPGSDFVPLSSHLNFLGFSVPYWYYVSGNNVISENVPTKSEMEKELEEFVAADLDNCNFDEFYEKGYYIDRGEPKVNVRIDDNRVSVNVAGALAVSNEEQSAVKNSHNVEIDSKLGKFYNLAKEVYDKQKKDAFIENYSVDVLRFYAPVDGVEVQCGPKTWKTQEVLENLRVALENNIAQIKLEGNYYSLSNKEKEYFVVNQRTDEQVNFLYSKEWPSVFEVTPADNNLMIAEPLGADSGLNVFGFCYVPYHFVYDLKFPVMAQISDGVEIFQFPMAVIIDNNVPRNAILSETEEESNVDICAFAETEINVKTYDLELNPIKAEVKYECFDSVCDLGETKLVSGVAEIDALAPACVNGYLIAKAEGYADSKVLFSSNRESEAEIIMERVYDIDVDVYVDGKLYNGTAVVHFAKDDKIYGAVIPESDKIVLVEGLYKVDAYVYGESGITIPASTKTQCTNVAAGGISGILGRTKEQCIDIQIPETKIDYALIGGGKQEVYILPSELEKGRVRVSVQSLPRADTLEKLQYNYEIFSAQGLEVEFV